MSWHKKLFGIEKKGRPLFHNSRKQLFRAGLLCLLIHPGIVLFTVVTGLVRLDFGEEVYILLNPFTLITILGFWIIGMAAFSTHDWPKFQKDAQEKKRNKLGVTR